MRPQYLAWKEKTWSLMNDVDARLDKAIAASGEVLKESTKLKVRHDVSENSGLLSTMHDSAFR